MKGNSTVLICFLLCAISMEAQSLLSKRLEGRVYSKEGDVAATHVLNITAQKATITDVNGFFSISVKLNDTLVFSAIQFKRKEVVVSPKVLESKFLLVPLEEALTELDEVVVRLYNLSGDMGSDLNNLETESVVTASTLGLPNAYVKPPTQAERQFFEATTGGGIVPLNPILNAISGRTKMLKNRLKRNTKYERTQRVRAFYPDSLFVKDLKIPQESIPDFMYFCEVDSTFQAIVDTHDQLKIWEYMRKKSQYYRKNNKLE
ncbi:carboxypeptidase-like regulatory domain-containing protein [Ulvibacterium sp.]|uniref:carboxypeptidase-like regulatory domain-containing protein n=1 Tax=Ulvibacterium sp. TaxID=2665914 RepID=UPI003BAB0F92